ncbi:MAG: phosphatidylglycerophosphatase A [Phycisphaerae bacterium]|jgi:phosphatidylglycerophosphatase A|nr:phosphatidylglycerophosphatase A [Phycisphaerae bacterium]
MNRFRKFLTTGLGLGYAPFAPGTFGSAGAVGVFALTVWIAPKPICVIGVMALVAIFFSVVCVRLGPFTEKAFGKKDPSQCTADEWAGQAVAMLGLPIVGCGAWITCWAGFAAFRLFDITKPPPVRQLEKLPQGWGVLVDDLAAGVYANIVAQVILRLWLAG